MCGGFEMEILQFNKLRVEKNTDCTILECMKIIAFSQMRDDLAVLKILTSMSEN